MAQAELNIMTSGHVDHGKSTLVGALTGVFPDTHSEEVKRGITIKLGYADATISKCGKCGKLVTNEMAKGKCAYCSAPASELQALRKVSFLDAPGHETLMATVVAASSIVDGGLLIIAANEECPQPQTLEHFLVLQAVGVKHLVIVQTKVDLVEKAKAVENYNKIKALIKGTAFENAPIIPVSAVHSTNLNRLLEAIQESIPTPERNDKAEPLFLVARSFDVNLPGAKIEGLKGGVLGGSVVRGSFKSGDEIEIVPGYLSVRKERETYHAIKTKIVGLHAGGKVESARPGGLVGIGTSLDPALTRGDGLAGNFVVKSGSPAPVFLECAVEITPVARSLAKFSEGFVENEPLVFGIGTETTVGFVQGKAKGKGKKAYSIRFKKPVCAVGGTPFAILRRSANRWHFYGTAKIV